MAGQNEDLQGPDDGVKHTGVATNSEDQTDQTEEEGLSEEYGVLDLKLDELNSALDYLEQKNDDIHAQLKELLQSNIDIRQQLQNENNMEVEGNN